MKKGNKILTPFKDFIKARQWQLESSRTLLAVSGGLDSVIMAHLFYEARFDFAIAHCNFKLRGSASERDEKFVRALADSWKVSFFCVEFETEELAEARNLSIQEVARELRYDWLEEVRQENEFTYMATAHHLNDSVETVLYNWTKGAGIRGLHGIPAQNNKIIRPLLFATREDIELYANEQGISFRQDESNLAQKYNRNKIRHSVIPVLKKINPKLEVTVGKNLERIREAEALYDLALDHLKKIWMQQEGPFLKIAIQPLRNFIAARTCLYEWLHPFGFSNGQTDQIYESLEGTPGALFFSPSHRLLIDREWLLVEAFEKTDEVFSIEQTSEKEIVLTDGVLKIERKEDVPKQFPSSALEVYLDWEALRFPLQLRHWAKGDRFAPLGMGGKRQKLQDFFSNQKVSIFEKERTWLLVNGDGEIIWLLGMRISEKVKITEKTRHTLHLKFEKS